MELISGSQIAEEIKSALRVKNQEAGIIPQLEVVLVGENEESKVYVNLKEKAALSISARFLRSKSHSPLMKLLIHSCTVLPSR
jgi:5,10-methylene-tetrahydrofolate dehydrogenase/methenyl tetrahydrofolate cyclohydrolase